MVYLCVRCVPVLKSVSAWHALSGCLCLLPETHLRAAGFQNPSLGPLKLGPNCLFGLFSHCFLHPTQPVPAICQLRPGPFTLFPPSPHTHRSPAWNSLPLPHSLSPLAPVLQPHLPSSYPSFKARLECHFLPNAHPYPAPQGPPSVGTLCACPAGQPCSVACSSACDHLPSAL